jgi:hypothetical protein
MIQEDEDRLRQFNQDWDKKHSTSDSKPPIDLGKNGGDNISLIQSVQQTMNTGVYVPPSIPTTGNQCPQCGTIHPPLRPGEECPIAKSKQAETPKPTPQTTQPLTEGKTKSIVKDDMEPLRPTMPPPPPKPIVPQRHDMAPYSAVREPESLAENNIPVEIHINKYLNSWGEMIQAHCKKYGITNTKKLMRHLTIEISDFLENYKER